MGAATLPKKIFVQRPARWECDVAVTVDDGCCELEGRIANMSNDGFMAECERKLPLGSVVAIDIPGKGKVRAEVRWAVGWRFGARFLKA